MEFLNFEDVFDLAEDINNMVVDDIELSVIAPYEIVEELLRTLVIDDIYTLKDISICNPELDNYNDSYLLEIDRDFNIWTYKVLNEGKYLISSADVLFVYSRTKNEVFENIDYDSLFVFNVDEYIYDCDGDCENCVYSAYEDDVEECEDIDTSEDTDDCECCEKDTEQTGFTISGNNGSIYWTKSFYSNDKDLVKEMMRAWK